MSTCLYAQNENANWKKVVDRQTGILRTLPSLEPSAAGEAKNYVDCLFIYKEMASLIDPKKLCEICVRDRNKTRH